MTPRLRSLPICPVCSTDTNKLAFISEKAICLLQRTLSPWAHMFHATWIVALNVFFFTTDKEKALHKVAFALNHINIHDLNLPFGEHAAQCF